MSNHFDDPSFLHKTSDTAPGGTDVVEADRKSGDSPGVIADAFRSFAYTAAQAPINGIVQLYDHCRGTKHLPDVQFIDPCKPAEMGTANWHAQLLGGGFGMAADFFLARKLGGGLANLAGRSFGLANAEALNLAAGAATTAGEINVARSIINNGLTGLAYEGLFREVKADKDNFWKARFNNAITGAATFGILSGVSEAPGMRNLANPLRSALAGIPAGIAHANVDSLMSGNGFASSKAMTTDAYGFMFVGGAMGTAHCALDYLSSAPTKSGTAAASEDAKPELGEASKPARSSYETNVELYGEKLAKQILGSDIAQGMQILEIAGNGDNCSPSAPLFRKAATDLASMTGRDFRTTYKALVNAAPYVARRNGHLSYDWDITNIKSLSSLENLVRPREAGRSQSQTMSEIISKTTEALATMESCKVPMDLVNRPISLRY